MRISQIMLAKGFGGAERSFVDTALALVDRGHTVQAICHSRFSKIALLEGVEGIQLDVVNAGAELDFITPRRIAKQLRSFRSEIVHTQLKRAAWHGGRGASLAGVPVVAKLHNYVDLRRYKYVHTLFCTTQDQRRHVLESEWPESRVKVVPNFSRLSPVDYPSTRGAVGPLRFLSYGRYVKKKGFDLLLRGFRQLLDAGVDATLTIGGQGDGLPALHQLVEELNLESSVELGVWIEDVSAALDAADVFVLPSLDEPFGIVMLEAMARGVSIVSTRTKGPVEVLDKGTAILVDVGSVDALFHGMHAAALDPVAAFKRSAAALELYRRDYYASAILPQIEAHYGCVMSDV